MSRLLTLALAATTLAACGPEESGSPIDATITETECVGSPYDRGVLDTADTGTIDSVTAEADG